MEVLPLLVFACMAVSFILHVNSHQCFKCDLCGSAVATGCNASETRCGTLVFKEGKRTNTTKRCTRSMECSKLNQTNPCVKIGLSLPNCTYACCERDLCTTDSRSSSTKHLPEFTATIGILIPSVLLAKVI